LSLPTLAIIGPYRFYFWSAEPGEPAHVHVERDRSKAKFWLDPVDLVWSKGFNEHEENRIERIVAEHQHEWKRKWDEYFADAE
jgi:hypothetical protein